jgi:hypothetical protein
MRRLLLDSSNIKVRFFFAKKNFKDLQTSPDCGTANLLGLIKANVYSFFAIEKLQSESSFRKSARLDPKAIVARVHEIVGNVTIIVCHCDFVSVYNCD